MRQKLPDRRQNVTRKVVWTSYGGKAQTILVTFGFRKTYEVYEVAEVFCADFKAGSDTQGIVTDTCILISRLLQLGEKVDNLCASMCEPASLIGAILHAAREEEIEAYAIEDYKLSRAADEVSETIDSKVSRTRTTEEPADFPWAITLICLGVLVGCGIAAVWHFGFH